ncbi:hypothetical protein N7448_006158 [Penicillium atrosanguineum]|uniref:Uncharacterized protein n=1 Tax=Penicillium atrosanguineum TaxID=1132637 RepID=A0A9W9GXT1_9EURO|nr:permease of the major facilitator superfamily [Penicillium atrosanguineum]KAJ5132000.1 hypothetical protein N7448_006158 [Penicillium atrosanguineum]KAJ5137791.1 hypothetical protein N7526_004024 [Penicillium atrosanguineum]KAJ5289668.1 permease of the major facilitator superfamily [Penicillium atrosanguineum]KAJ5307486.1 hypothetical protein N7476_008142 [Penicillium atrosanguineum]
MSNTNNPADKLTGNDVQEKQTYSEWAKKTYGDQYENWMPWIEDQYLRWFGKGDNKASYATKEQLAKTKVTGIDQVDQIQDDVSNLAGNQVGDKGLFAPVGQFASKEGINRAERNGKDESGSHAGPAKSYVDTGKDGASNVGSGLAQGAESAQNYVAGGLGGAKSLLSGEK